MTASSSKSPAGFLFNQPYMLLTATSLFWAGNAIAGRLTLGEASPFVIVFLRWLFVALALVALYHRSVRASWPILKPNLFRLAAMAAVGFTGFNALFYTAAHMTTGINIGILQGSIPVIVLIGTVIVFSTTVTFVQILGTLVTVTGVVVVATGGDPNRLATLQFAYGDGVMIVACLFYAVFTLALKNRPAVSGMVLMTVLAVFAFLTSIPVLAYEFLAGDVLWPSRKGWIVLAYIAVFPSFLAQVFFIRGVELIGPGRAGVFVNLVPVFAAILAVLILNESFHLYHGVALALVLGGIYVAERKTKAKSPSAAKLKP